MSLKNEEYLNHIRGTPCLVCYLEKHLSEPPSNPHHEETSRRYGAQKRMNDYTALPLCNRHHEERHRVGFGPFWTRYADIALPYVVTVSFLKKFARMCNITLNDEAKTEDLLSLGVIELKTRIDTLSEHVHEVYTTGENRKEWEN